MKLSIEQKEKIYQHLLTLNCPDLLAALVANRSCDWVEFDNIIELKCVSGVIGSAFPWMDSKEGWDFWDILYTDILDVERKSKLIEEETREENEASWAAIDAHIDPTHSTEFGDQPAFKNTTFLDKIRLFFGKIFYGV